MEKEKRIEELINIELCGISRVILEYSTDHFVVSYAEKLRDKDFCARRDLLKYVINELHEWYSKEIEEILAGEYIINKILHKKSYLIICELNELLKEYNN